MKDSEKYKILVGALEIVGIDAELVIEEFLDRVRNSKDGELEKMVLRWFLLGCFILNTNQSYSMNSRVNSG